jgi:mycoredoxin
MDPVSVDGQPSADAVVVYWRPGCGYCNRLLKMLRAEGVTLQLHNIWEDPTAREFVQAHNRGNETVPTVTVGTVTRTNPDPRTLIDELRERYPHLVGEPSPDRKPLHRLRGR